ncbi:flagellar export chaperone FliS [Cohnella suwonensis]|uniref:Flagellar secretion chaperone FliS n=1 Tax=Cohnella suwonensis TaxID=696072 RepID=A0ABW0LWI1_9BACL
MASTPYQKYQQSSVQTASPAQLILLLYDGAIRFIKQGVDSMENRNIEKTNENLIKAQKVVNELVASLDHQYSIAQNLAKIYEYILHLLITANLKKDTAPAVEALNYLVELKEAWSQAAKAPSSSISGHG